jgi:serine/threonine protein phosphatase 1
MSRHSSQAPDWIQPSVPAGTRVYAVGDIHGQRGLFERLLEKIAADLAYSAPERVVLVSLGDIIDRGAESRRVIELLMGEAATGELAGIQIVTIRGNHEDSLTQFLADFSTAAGWLRYGGLETIRSYAGSIPDGMVQDWPALQKLLYRSLPPDHLRFLARMPVSHVEGDYLFVHAGIRPGVALERQDPYDLMWIREPFLSSTQPARKLVVHGHTVVPAPDIRPNRIGIDTGAYRSGRLTCLVLEGDERRFLST